MKKTINMNFSDYNNVDLLHLSRNVISKTTENRFLFYNNIIIKNKDKIVELTKQFESLINKRAQKEREQCKSELIKYLSQLASAIKLKYNGKNNILELTGFDLISKRDNIYPIRDIVLEQSNNEGFINVKMLGGHNYKTIEVLYTTDKNKNEKLWKRKKITKKSTKIGRFVKDTNIYVKLIAYSRNRYSVESLVKSIGIQ